MTLAVAERDIPHNKFLVNSQLTAQLPNLVLEQLAQRLNEPQALAVHHALRQASDIVMRLFTLVWKVIRRREYIL